MRFIFGSASIFSMCWHWILVIEHLYKGIAKLMGVSMDEQGVV